jgi:hypothetical protein
VRFTTSAQQQTLIADWQGIVEAKYQVNSDNLPEFSFGPSLKCRGKFGHSRIYHPEQSADKLVRGLQSGQDSFRELEKKLKVVTFDPSPEILPLFEGGVIQCHA